MPSLLAQKCLQLGRLTYDLWLSLELFNIFSTLISDVWFSLELISIFSTSAVGGEKQQASEQ